MPKAVAEIGVGALAIAAPIVLPGIGIAISATMAASLTSMGASMALAGALSGLSSLMGNQGGVRTAAKNPIGSWGYAYGFQLVAPTEIFQESNNSQGTSNNKELHRVFALACHPCAIGPLGTWQLRIDGKAVLFHQNGSAFDSYSPTQTTLNITSATRAAGVVTIKLSGSLSNYNGLPALITTLSDNTMNGTWLLTQPNPSDATTFTYVCGGNNGSATGGKCKTTYPDYSNKIHVEFLNGNHTSTFPGLLSSNTSWSTSDLCLGRTMAYVRMGYDSSYFPSGVPNISFVIQGKNDILDPRTGLKGYTNNAALCIADYLSLPASKGGFGLTIGTDIPTAELIAAANLCDETMALAAGGTQAQFMLDAFFQLNKGRGSILQDLLTSCAGRLSYQGGTYQVFPGGWTAPVLALTEADIYGEMEFSHRHSIRDTCNAVKGVFTGSENNWSQADVPPYMQDAMHGYASDQWLAEDKGERIFRDANFPCTSTSAAAQRLAKIDLMRTRYQVRGTIRCSMRAYQLVALDTLTLTHRRYGWLNKLFEALSSRLVIGKGDQATLMVELDIAECGPDSYDWSSIEQLTPQGWKEPANANLSIVSPVEMLDVYSGPAMASPINPLHPRPLCIIKGADGIQRSNLWCSWVSPNDPHVLSGGHIEVQWQQVGDSSWASAGKFDPSTTECWLGSVIDGNSYNVQVRAINVAGAVSDWVAVLGTTIALAGSTMNATSVTYSNGTSVDALMPAEAGAQQTAGKPIDILVDGTTYGRIRNTHIQAGVPAYSGGQTIDSLQPLEAGANVTETRVSLDTTKVNGTAASTVVTNAQLGGTSPQEMVANGNFENGSTGWTLGGNSISTANKYAGTSSLQSLNSTSTQTVAGLLAGHTYLLQMWVMTNGGVVGTNAYGAGVWGAVSAGTVSVLHSNGNTHGFSSNDVDIELAASSATGWTLIQVSFVPSANCSLSLNVQNSLGGGSVTGTAWFDGISLTDITTHTAQLGGVVASSITPIATLMPAQAGADKTSSNTAANTSAVGSRSATDVQATVQSGGGIDFASGLHANKTLDNVGDGSTFARVKSSGLSSGGVNYASTTHTGQLPLANHAAAVTTAINSSGQVQNVGGLAASTITPYSLPNSGSAQWVKLGTWVFSTVPSSLTFVINSGIGYNSGNTQQAVTHVTVRSSNNVAAPNLSGISYYTQGGSSPILGIVANATGGSTSASNSSWDIYIDLAAFSGGSVVFTVMPGDGWTWSGATSQSPSTTASSTCVVATGGQVFGAGGTGLDAVIEGSTYARVKAAGLSNGGVDLSSSLHINKTMQYVADYAAGGRYAAAESGANVTSAHALTSTAKPSSDTTVSTSWVSLPGFGWSAMMASSDDVYNIQAIINLQANALTTGDTIAIAVVVDGNTSSPAYSAVFQPSSSGSPIVYPYAASITGLSAGSHTIQFYAKVTGNSRTVFAAVTYAICQRIF